MGCRTIRRGALRALFAGIAGCVLTASPLRAQSFNIDIDSPTSGPALGGGVPSPSFGAAPNQQGFWTSYPATSNPVSLVDLNSGLPTAATVQVTASSTTVSVLAFNNPANTGDFALLFNDGSQIGTTIQGGNRTYNFSGLLDGPYAVYTYTGRPQGTDGEIQIDVIGSNEGPTIASGVPIGNTFTLGVTHVVHTLNVVGGSFDLRALDIPGAPAAYIGGFQIVVIPEPGSVALVAGFVSLLARRRR